MAREREYKKIYITPKYSLVTAVPALGRLPDCVGHYESRNPECDKPCPWRSGCIVYQIYAEERAKEYNIDPEAFVATDARTLPPRARALMIRELLRAVPIEWRERDPRQHRGWDRFLETFIAMDPGVPIMAGMSRAADGELYHVPLMSSYNEPNQHAIRVKDDTWRVSPRQPHLTIIRYHLGIKSRVEPTLEFRCSIKTIFDKYPQIQCAATRWRGCASVRSPVLKSKHTTRAARNMGAKAIKIFSERIEDFARASAGLVRGGCFPGVYVRDGKVVLDKTEVRRWRWRGWKK